MGVLQGIEARNFINISSFICSYVGVQAIDSLPQ